MAASLAAPDADPHYAQYQWPGAVSPYGVSTCFGCRPGHLLGKRAADPGPEPHGVHGGGVALHPHGASFVGPTTYGYPGRFYHHLGKRSAAPEPHGATAYVGRTVFGYPRGHLGLYHHYGKRSAEPHGAGLAVHPGHATSFVGPTTFGYPRLHYGKRQAEQPWQPSSGGYGKRDADADADADAEADPWYGYYGGYGGYGYGWPGGYTRLTGHYGYPYWG